MAVARVLRRMLVVPDYMADNGEGEDRSLVVCSACNCNSIGRFRMNTYS